MDVAIVGVGLHPFGRFPTPAQDMATTAIRAALTDTGVQWSDIDFAVGGSRDGGHADALVQDLGLTGTPFMAPVKQYYPNVDRCSWELPVFHELLRRSLRWARGRTE